MEINTQDPTRVPDHVHKARPASHRQGWFLFRVPKSWLQHVLSCCILGYVKDLAFGDEFIILICLITVQPQQLASELTHFICIWQLWNSWCSRVGGGGTWELWEAHFRTITLGGSEGLRSLGSGNRSEQSDKGLMFNSLIRNFSL